MKKKSLALVLALAMIVVCVVGGTLAWLIATTPEVKNTFTYGDINIKLEETDATVSADGSATKEFKMIPGYTIDKDPTVTVVKDSEDCYLFVKVEKSTNFDNYMNYAIDNAWTELESGVYYIKIDTEAKKDVAYSVLGAGSETYSNVEYTWSDNQVLVKPTVTKADMNALNADGAQPTLTFTAYAVQLNKNNTTEFTAEEAWALAKTLPTT